MNPTERLQQVGEMLRARSYTVVCAESCTGGAIAAQLTALAGSSTWFDRGFVAYSHNSKVHTLGVPIELLEAHGSVSVQCVAAMVSGALERSDANVALAVSGVAGPGGGSPDKPVGSVCFAWSHRGGGEVTKQRRLSGDRAAIREASVVIAIDGLITFLNEFE